MPIHATLFDVDGTLLDTREFIYRSFEKTLEKHGMPVPERESLMQMTGKSLKFDYKTLTSLPNVDFLCETHRNFQKININLVKTFSGTETILRELKERDISIAVVTSRMRIGSLATLEYTNIAKYFDVIIAADDVVEHKPHPESVLKVLSYLKIHRSKALMIGDRQSDIEAGKRAGVKTVGATYGHSGTQIYESGADHFIDSIKEFLPLLYKLTEET